MLGTSQFSLCWSTHNLKLYDRDNICLMYIQWFLIYHSCKQQNRQFTRNDIDLITCNQLQHTSTVVSSSLSLATNPTDPENLYKVLVYWPYLNSMQCLSIMSVQVWITQNYTVSDVADGVRVSISIVNRFKKVMGENESKTRQLHLFFIMSAVSRASNPSRTVDTTQ